MKSGLIFALLLASAAYCDAQAPAARRHSLTLIADQRLQVKTAAGTGMLPLYLSRDWTRAQKDITWAVVVVHGALRNADDYLRAILDALAAGGDRRATLVVAPQFLAERDARALSMPETILRWGSTSNGWMAGQGALGPAAVSSFEAIDAIIARLADRKVFPRLTEVLLAGHSAGAQLVQRYAVVGHADAALAQIGIGVRYIVADPSSYLYFSPDRPDSNGDFTHFESARCGGFNRWKYGWLDAPAYARQRVPADYERAYATRRVVYLLGAADTDPGDPALDKSCAAEAQGPNRYERGLSYARYLRARHPDLRHRVIQAPGIGHDAGKILSSPCGLAALFDRSECAAH